MKTRSFKLKNRTVGDGKPTYIIAEIGINHEGSLDTALQLVNAAADSGVDAVKFQTYITEQRTPATSPIFNILKKCELPFDAFDKIKKHAESKKVDFFSTPFDLESLQYLESIGCEFYKIASFDITNHKLLEAIGKTKKPAILSIGMSNHQEIKKAYDVLSAGTQNIALLHCITSYPMPEGEANLSAIYTLRSEFDCVIGQSDHTPDIQVPLYAVAAGARILEKHFKLKNQNCVDGPVSIDPDQMASLVRETRRLEAILGKPELQIREIEKQYQWLRRF